MKEKKSGAMILFWGATGAFVFLTVAVAITMLIVFCDDLERARDITAAIFAIMLLVYLPVALMAVELARKLQKEQETEMAEEVKRKLTTEFRTVFIKDSAYIPEKKVKCQAKVNNDGKIICEIHVDDFTMIMSNYETFCKYFYLPDDE